MKRFKKLDLVIQILLPIGCVLYGVIFQEDEMWMLTPCIAGGWHVFSMVVHQFVQPILKGSTRWYYHRFTLGTLLFYGLLLLVSSLGWDIHEFVLWAAILLFVGAPILAIYYFILCDNEYKSPSEEYTSHPIV